jgi:hypothetical protein
MAANLLNGVKSALDAGFRDVQERLAQLLETQLYGTR